MPLRWIRRPLQLAMLKEPAYRFLFEPAPPDEAVSLDCETTGLDRRRDDVVTVAAIRIRGARILTSERFEAKLRPEAPMKPDAIKVHRLREADVAEGRADERRHLAGMRRQNNACFASTRPVIYFA